MFVLFFSIVVANKFRLQTKYRERKTYSHDDDAGTLNVTKVERQKKVALGHTRNNYLCIHEKVIKIRFPNEIYSERREARVAPEWRVGGCASVGIRFMNAHWNISFEMHNITLFRWCGFTYETKTQFRRVSDTLAHTCSRSEKEVNAFHVLTIQLSVCLVIVSLFFLS